MKLLGYAPMVVGITIALGPIAIFLLMVLIAAVFPCFFDDDAILLWHYISSLGFIIYMPVGSGTFFLGRWLRGTGIGPARLRVGDSFVDESGREWEVAGQPSTTVGGKVVNVTVQRVGLSAMVTERSWAAHERIRVQRTASTAKGKR